MMRTFTSMKQGMPINLASNSKSAQAGFTLIEILVAIFLVTFILGVVLTGSQSHSKHLDEVVSGIDRAVRFGADESALRNVVVRVHFKLEEIPQVFAVEYGPNAQFIPLPRSETDLSTLTGSELEQIEAQIKELNNKFNRIRELQDQAIEIPETVTVLGLGTTNTSELIKDGDMSVYIFPTGEKENAVVYIASEEEMVQLEIEPFTMDIIRTNFPHPHGANIDERIKMAEDLFKDWLTEK